jgi:DTW domain-containing protein YfiP
MARGQMMPETAASTSCIGCRLRSSECVCELAPRLQLATRLFVIVHCKEWRRTTNTGHLARLAVDGGVVRQHGLMHRTVNSDGIEPLSPSTLVLFPGRGAEPLTPALIADLPQPLTLLVPDGNWNQTKHMMRRVPMFHQATPVRLVGSNRDFAGLRQNRLPDRMSTFEAITLALGIIEGPAVRQQLMTFFQQYLENGILNSRRAARRRSGNGMSRTDDQETG